MKALLLTAVMATASFAHAQNCVTADGMIVPNGKTVALYYSANPTKEIGPNYTCEMTARTRTCVDGTLSQKTITCSEYDSGGCVDWWMDRLSDADFSVAQCKD